MEAEHGQEVCEGCGAVQPGPGVPQEREAEGSRAGCQAQGCLHWQRGLLLLIACGTSVQSQVKRCVPLNGRTCNPCCAPCMVLDK